MDMIRIENSVGLVSLIATVSMLIALKGSKPHQFITVLVGTFLIAFAAMTAATFSNFEAIAKILNLKHKLSDNALEESLRINSLWVLIYPALVGALGVNLLTSWFQSSKPKTEEDPIEMTVPRQIAEQSAADVGGNIQNEQRSPASTQRSRKNVRSTLIRKR
ncbi:hypothetical protein [Paraburkholderia sp. MM5482-R1]|uniref:hypothetical protein n=1 Tax=unclassified Paraburkholderia TaxID=2615204 RepID=UPI003D219E94